MFFAFALTAQEKSKATPEERAEKMTAKMAEKYELDGDKKDQLSKINSEFMESINEVKDDTSLSRDQKKAKIETIVEKRHKDLESVLTAEQLEELKKVEKEKMDQKMQAAQQRKMEMKMTPEEHAKKKTDHLKEELALTDDQYNKVYELSLKVSEKIEAIKKDDTMDQERKKKFIHGNMKDFHNEMKSILTAEQFEKFEALKDKHKEDMPHKGPQ